MTVPENVRSIAESFGIIRNHIGIPKESLDTDRGITPRWAIFFVLGIRVYASRPCDFRCPMHFIVCQIVSEMIRGQSFVCARAYTRTQSAHMRPKTCTSAHIAPAHTRRHHQPRTQRPSACARKISGVFKLSFVTARLPTS